MKSYKQSWVVHLICPVMLLIVSSIVFQAFTNPKVSASTRNGVAILVVFYDLGVLYLYLATCLNRYDVTEEGLHVRRFFLFRSHFYPWNQIVRIYWAWRIKTFIVYGPKGVIFFSSTDCFPNLGEFLRILHQRSACNLSPRLEKVLLPKADS